MERKHILLFQPHEPPAQCTASRCPSRQIFPGFAQQIFLAALSARFASSQNEFAALIIFFQGAVCPLWPPFGRPFTPEDIFSPVMRFPFLPNQHALP